MCNMDEDEYVRITQKQYEFWAKKCSSRAEKIRQQLFETKSSDESADEDEKSGLETKPEVSTTINIPGNLPIKKSLFRRIVEYRFPETIDPYSDSIYLVYQVFVTFAFLYNACGIPMRMSFPIETESNRKFWFVVDYTCDFVYLIDMVIFQVRCQFIQGGNFMRERKDTRKHYLKSKGFALDVLSLLPLELFYLVIGFRPVLRINRLMKFHSFIEFNNKFEMVLENAYVYRIAVTTFYLLYFIHVDACLYYYTSYYKEFKTPWGYQKIGNPYIRCYFWAFMTTVTIGNMEKATTDFEFIFQLSNFFLGLFIFSIVIGQVRDSVQANSADQEDYRRVKNDCIYYMEKNNIPPLVQKKVREWFEYTWDTQKILDESQLFNQIPTRMHNEIAENLHIDVLNQVDLFKGCDHQLLHDLVVKLHPVLYLPGDYICRKGEVGREMYIISNGTVQVVGETKAEVFVTLRAGTAFGEISLLAVGGANRRTANIYSPGFATLFLLMKNDLNEAVRNYPRTQAILRRKARNLLKRDRNKPVPPPVTDSRLLSSQASQPKNTGLGARLMRTIVREADSRNKNFRFMGQFRGQDKESK